MINLDQIYFFQSLVWSGFVAPGGNGAADWINELDFYQKFNWSYLAVTWTSIFLVKFSFLTFFSGLCDRLPRAELYRKITYGFCIVSYIIALVNAPIVCPYLGSSQCELLVSAWMMVAETVSSAVLDS